MKNLKKNAGVGPLWVSNTNLISTYNLIHIVFLAYGVPG